MTELEAPHRLVGSVWLRCAGWICLVAIAILSLIPGQWQARTGLPGPVEHFIAYFIAAAVITLGARSGRFPAAVIVILAVFSGAMEILQHWSPGRDPALIGFIGSSVGAATGALLAHGVRRRV